MKPFLFAIVFLLILLLVYVLYYVGIAVTRVGFGWFQADVRLPSRWTGTFNDSSGILRRNFVVFRRFRQLRVEVETVSGTLTFEIQAPDGSPLSPTSGVYGRDASLLFDLSGLRRCSVTLRMERFHGTFCVQLQ